MSTITVRDIPADLQDFLKADAAANHRSVNKQVLVALQAYRSNLTANVKTKKSPEQITAAMNQIRAEVQAIKEKAISEGTWDARSDDEILGYNEHGHFD